MSKTYNKVKVIFQQVIPTPAISNYINKRLRLPALAKVDTVECHISKRSNKGSRKFSVRFMLVINGAKMFFHEKGNNIYHMIDSIIKKLRNQFTAITSSNSAINPSV